MLAELHQERRLNDAIDRLLQGDDWRDAPDVADAELSQLMAVAELILQVARDDRPRHLEERRQSVWRRIRSTTGPSTKLGPLAAWLEPWRPRLSGRTSGLAIGSATG